jgi:glycosyltransferase involved in cell wall biosynthesis
MRFGLIGPTYPHRGGIAHHTTMLAKRLSASHDVLVVSYRRQYPPILYPGETDRDPSRSKLRAPAELIIDPLNPFSWGKAAARLQAWQPDLVVMQWWVTYWAPTYAWVTARLRRSDTQVVFIVHNALPHEERRWDRVLARHALKRGSGIIVHNPLEAERLRALLPRADIAVTPLPDFDSVGGGRLDRQEALRRLGLDHEKPLLLFFGFVRPYKGLKCLLEAMHILRSGGESVSLVVAGEFWESRRSYEAMIHRLGLDHSVTLIDRYIPNEEVNLYFSAANALVAPHIAGTQSGAAAIALAYQLPLILTERISGGLSDEDRARATIVEPGDPSALAAGIQSWLKSSGRSEPFGARRDDHWSSMLDILESRARQGGSGSQRR